MRLDIQPGQWVQSESVQPGQKSARSQPVSLDSHREREIQKEESAIAFEKIFAKHLVEELTKDSFQMSDNQGGLGSSNRLYREFVVEALSSELAGQRRLGMADLVEQYWNQRTGSSEIPTTDNPDSDA